MENNSKTLAVIFDMDGVLVDSYQAHFESWRQTAQAHGLDMTEQQFAGTFGRTTREIITALWGDHVSGDSVGLWDDQKELAYRGILDADFPAMHGAGALLASLREAGMKLAIGSSGPPENVELVLEHLGRDIFAGAVTARDVTHGKPHPEVFLKAAGKLRIDPINCAVVEDAPAGIQAARRAGMVAIALTGTAQREKLAAEAHLVVDSLDELSPEIIDSLISGSSRR
ncbi:MAG: HAD family phosphatase [Phycisphaerae bacterium]|jgi:beta-phosphoglucomutase|nr:HAD family phosphatase [Phycisphaerae bacterium]MDP7286861.1 HAD family phosphatase [Phycisphaerae bacterium]